MSDRTLVTTLQRLLLPRATVSFRGTRAAGVARGLAACSVDALAFRRTRARLLERAGDPRGLATAWGRSLLFPWSVGSTELLLELTLQ